ncbi:hypothetical protein N7522_001573 [Penicillium canescens]|nr:hypothetical protein N7522_001573 [Penicillium canescens]
MPQSRNTLHCFRPLRATANFPQQSYLSPSSGPVFEAYKFYRAGKEATWACAERTELYMKQEQLCNLTHSRAEEFEVEWQYQKLSPNQRAQVDRLVQDRRAEYPGMVWSYVYAKENSYAKVTRNPRPDDSETTSMVIILMRRPMKPTKYPITHMGDYVDIRKLRDRHDDSMNHSRSPSVTPQWRHRGIGPAGYYGSQGPHSASRSVGRYPSQGSDSGRVVASVCSTGLDSGLLPVYDQDGVLSSGSHHDPPFAQPGGALPVTGSFKVPPQLPGQHQQSSTSQSSRRPDSPHYPPGSNGLSQKRTRFGNPDFEFTSATSGQNGAFQAPTPKRICRLRGIYQGHGVQSQETKYRTS